MRLGVTEVVVGAAVRRTGVDATMLIINTANKI